MATGTYSPIQLKQAVNAVINDGMSRRAAAEKFNVSRSTLKRAIENGRICKVPLDTANRAQQAVAARAVQPTDEATSLFADIAHRVTGLQIKALIALEGALSAEKFAGTDADGAALWMDDHPTRLKAAAEILDRGGMLPKLKTIRTELNDLPTLNESPETIRAAIEKKQAMLADMGEE